MRDVTLVIPTYNPRRDWFEAMLDSIPWWRFAEIIICDDGSDIPVPEATFRHEKNEGIVSALNDSFDRVKTKWVAQLGHDDTFDREGVTALLNAIDDINADVVHWPVRVWPGPWIWKANDASFDEMRRNNSIPGASWVTKEAWERIGRFQYTLCEDWEFWLRAASNNLRFHYFDRIIYNYRSDSHGYCEMVVNKNVEQIRQELGAIYGLPGEPIKPQGVM